MSDEGTNFEAMFATVFTDPGDTAQRLAHDRKAAAPAKRRARKALRSKNLNMRASEEFYAVATSLADQQECSMADIIHDALFAYAATLKRRASS
jgi:hypothetical protein